MDVHLKQALPFISGDTLVASANRDACIARRERTNTPSQALLLLNESEYLKAARHLATQVISQNPENRVDYMWESVTSHLPDSQERVVVENLLSDLTKKYQSSPELAEVLCQGVDATNKTELAAWTMVGNVLYNLDRWLSWVVQKTLTRIWTLTKQRQPKLFVHLLSCLLHKSE